MTTTDAPRNDTRELTLQEVRAARASLAQIAARLDRIEVAAERPGQEAYGAFALQQAARRLAERLAREAAKIPGCNRNR